MYELVMMITPAPTVLDQKWEERGQSIPVVDQLSFLGSSQKQSLLYNDFQRRFAFPKRWRAVIKRNKISSDCLIRDEAREVLSVNVRFREVLLGPCDVCRNLILCEKAYGPSSIVRQIYASFPQVIESVPFTRRMHPVKVRY